MGKPCLHRAVERAHKVLPNGTETLVWVCLGCAEEFVPKAHIEALERQNKTYREGLLDENGLVLRQQARIEVLEREIDGLNKTIGILVPALVALREANGG